MTEKEVLPFVENSTFTFLNKRDRQTFLDLIMSITYNCVLLGSALHIDEETIIIDLTKSTVDLRQSNKHKIIEELQDIKDEISAIYNGLYDDENLEVETLPVFEISNN